MGSSRLRFLGGAFFGQQGESFYCTDAYTKTTHATGGGMGTSSPRQTGCRNRSSASRSLCLRHAMDIISALVRRAE